jgi:hypothetical protein
LAASRETPSVPASRVAMKPIFLGCVRDMDDMVVTLLREVNDGIVESLLSVIPDPESASGTGIDPEYIPP